MRIKLDWGTLDGNHHGPRQPNGECATKRLTAGIVPLGRDFYMMKEGRRLFGRRLWLYGPSGACFRLDFMVLFDRSPCPPGSKYGPRDDGGRGTIVL